MLPAVHQPGRYRIRVSGRLDPSWSDRFEGMAVRVRETEKHGRFTELSGVVADQAALLGLIGQLYAHGHVLLAVELSGESAPLEGGRCEARVSAPSDTGDEPQDSGEDDFVR